MDAPLGPALALGSSLAYGGADFAGGMISRRRPAMAVVGISQACSLVVLLVIVAVVGLPESWAWAPWAALAGASGSIGLVLFYQALSVGTVGVVSPISATGAMIPVLIAFAGGERPRPLVLLGIAVALLGAILASGPELRGEPHVKGRAVFYAMGAALGFGLAMYAIARGASTSLLATMTGMRVTSVLGFAVAALALRSLGGVPWREVPVLAVLGVCDIGANALLGMATTLGMLSVTIVLSSLYPVVTVALAAVILHERMRGIQVLGTASAIAGVVLIAAG